MDGMIRLARALPALLVWAAGCELLVSGQITDVHCQADGAVGPPACPEGYACAAGLCVQSALGTPCSTDSDCAGGTFCLDPLVWAASLAVQPPAADAGPQPVADAGPNLVADAGTVAFTGQCSRACCSSSDCDPDTQFVCVLAPASGGGFCRAAVDAHRAPGGTLDAMVACSSGADCRSGLCADDHCADTCCTDTSCAAGVEGEAACRFAGAPAPGESAGFWCAPPAIDKSSRYAPCRLDSDCESGLCGTLGASTTQICLSTCCESTDCESFNGVEVQCITLPPAQGGVRVCGALGGEGAEGAATGVACTGPTGCRSGLCIDHAGHEECSDTCCSNADCGDRSSFVCRPVNIAGGWPLRCEPK